MICQCKSILQYECYKLNVVTFCNKKYNMLLKKSFIKGKVLGSRVRDHETVLTLRPNLDFNFRFGLN